MPDFDVLVQDYHLHITQPITEHKPYKGPPDGKHAWTALQPGTEDSKPWLEQMQAIEQRNLRLDYVQLWPFRLKINRRSINE